MAFYKQLKPMLYCIILLEFVVLIALTSTDSLLLKIPTSAAFKHMKEKLFGDPFHGFDASGSSFETIVGINSPIQNTRDYSYKQPVNFSSQGRTVNILLSSEDINKSLSCSPTTFVKCDKPTRNITPTNLSYGIAMLRRPHWMTIKNSFNMRSCPYTNCYFQDSNINESTSVVFINLVLLNDEFKPIKRWTHQLYAASIWEAPPLTNAQLLKGEYSTVYYPL
ncbi:alpha-(1 3)-fucosyltransferase C [Biomphalaria pfeifferi]|uniref:Alpha-(1 3)-fucosyltransferase C n=1 Tax=Biomphalaria pfeifferi TaxID=112525 RepID=A0AAD8AXQ5_BIOPF|nr:alpha-(1 3)-fucosyltransferase C [Biomphalaria pfeifferi]